MYDAASLSDSTVQSAGVEISPHQRAVGELRVALRRRGAATVLDNLRQAGCLKARFPHGDDDNWLDVAMLNTSGGVAGGDRLDIGLALQAGARATFAAQAAERFYRALPGTAPARLRTEIVVADGAAAEWLPQETILFDRCKLDRVLDVRLSGDARFLGLEMLVFGRAAMGETVDQAELSDSIRVHRDGKPILWDAIRLHGDVGRILARPAVAQGARAVATLVMVAPDVATLLEPVRAALAEAPAETGASCWDGMLVVRALAESGAGLRQAMIMALHVLRDARALPRVWMC
jgi:urease accessory protein